MSVPSVIGYIAVNYSVSKFNTEIQKKVGVDIGSMVEVLRFYGIFYSGDYSRCI